MRRPDPYAERARSLAVAAGLDPDARVDTENGARGQPAWCLFKDAAKKLEQDAEYEKVPSQNIPLDTVGSKPLHINLLPENDLEKANLAKVVTHMQEILRVPTIVSGAIMPDACPVGSLGEIPVGGVAVAKDAIHPGMHSSDICCSMAVSIFNDTDPTAMLDAGMKLSHFGPGGRPYSHDMRPSIDLLSGFESNQYLNMMTDAAIAHFGTQGDGNHFYYVGRLKSTGQIALVTHHGSRKPGALLYKLGMDKAEWYRKRLSPETAKHNAWIPTDTDDGRAYWEALQLIRTWTKGNHYTIHDTIARVLNLKVKDRFWNEHNFVFRKTDGLFYHAKGATPAYDFFSADTNGLTLIPLNMAEPILISKGLNAVNGLGFAPHGAGRNVSRTEHMRQNASVPEAELVRQETQGIDARFFCGVPDVSELPSAYKNANSVTSQIRSYGLSEIVDTIEPIGCIMAGDVNRDAPWRKKRAEKQAAKE